MRSTMPKVTPVATARSKAEKASNITMGLEFCHFVVRVGAPTAIVPVNIIRAIMA